MTVCTRAYLGQCPRARVCVCVCVCVCVGAKIYSLNNAKQTAFEYMKVRHIIGHGKGVCAWDHAYA